MTTGISSNSAVGFRMFEGVGRLQDCVTDMHLKSPRSCLYNENYQHELTAGTLFSEHFQWRGCLARTFLVLSETNDVSTSFHLN